MVREMSLSGQDYTFRTANLEIYVAILSPPDSSPRFTSSKLHDSPRDEFRVHLVRISTKEIEPVLATTKVYHINVYARNECLS